MPNIKPLKKLVNKARDLRESHKERHRPTGFGFALADSIDYLDNRHWNAVTKSNSLFLSPRYLRVLEQAGPDNLRQRYALIFRGHQPVAAVAAQAVTVSLSRVTQKPRKGRTAAPLEKLQEKMLVCGNLSHGACMELLSLITKIRLRSGPQWPRRFTGFGGRISYPATRIS